MLPTNRDYAAVSNNSVASNFGNTANYIIPQ